MINLHVLKKACEGKSKFTEIPLPEWAKIVNEKKILPLLNEKNGVVFISANGDGQIDLLIKKSNFGGLLVTDNDQEKEISLNKALKNLEGKIVKVSLAE